MFFGKCRNLPALRRWLDSKLTVTEASEAESEAHEPVPNVILEASREQ